MRMTAILVAVAALILSASPAAARDTVLADPPPDWDNPRRILLQLTSDEERKASGILSNAVNLQKFYGQDNVKIAIVAYGAGVRPFLKQDSKIADRVASLKLSGIEFIACGNTLDTLHKTPADLLPGMEVATAGIAEVVERQLQGWVTVVP